MLIGADISHHNGSFIQPFGNFIIMKATEGRTYIDPKLVDNLNTWLSIADKYTYPLALYHFARPENGSAAEQEADAFLKVVEPFLRFSPILVLDWEGKALNKKYNTWAYDFLSHVYNKVGYRPFIYTNETGTKVLGKLCTPFPLWIASYNKKAPKYYNWKDYTLWQFTSVPFDLNLFKGDYETWKKLTNQTLIPNA